MFADGSPGRKPNVPLSTNVRAKSSLFSVKSRRCRPRSTTSDGEPRQGRGRGDERVRLAAMAHEAQAYDDGVLTVSCHVERPLDDRVREAYAAFRRRRPGGVAVASLLRPPEEREGSAGSLAQRAREAAVDGPFGLHTHWTGIAHARPTGGDPAARVREQGRRLAAEGLDATLFAGGGWYWDAGVGEAVAELGTRTAPRRRSVPPYLEAGRARLALAEPARLVLPSARACCAPSTHSVGMAAGPCRGGCRAGSTSTSTTPTSLDARRRAALTWALRLLGVRRRPTPLDALRERPRRPSGTSV